MRAFDGVEQLKQDLLAQVQASEDAGNIVHGVYGGYQTKETYDDDGWLVETKIVGPWRGCAVGVIVHGGHDAYGAAFHGIPRTLLYALESLFERDDSRDGTEFSMPRRFLEAIPVGADLSSLVDEQAWCESCHAYHCDYQATDYHSFDALLDAIHNAIALPVA